MGKWESEDLATAPQLYDAVGLSVMKSPIAKQCAGAGHQLVAWRYRPLMAAAVNNAACSTISRHQIIVGESPCRQAASEHRRHTGFVSRR